MSTDIFPTFLTEETYKLDSNQKRILFYSALSGRDEQGAKVSAGGNRKRREFIKFNDDEFKYLVEGDDEMSLMGGNTWRYCNTN